MLTHKLVDSASQKGKQPGLNGKMEFTTGLKGTSRKCILRNPHKFGG
jgi:hypothetical protein